MEGFKSPDSRLVRLFQKSREQWRKRAAEKQKKMRAMEIRIRDLVTSRDLWKAKALEAQREREQLEEQLENLKKQKKKPEVSQLKKLKQPSYDLPSVREQEPGELRPKGHSYLLCVIETAIKFLVTALNSLRGIEKNLEILTLHWCWSTPNFNTVRQWSLRLGLFELNRPKEYRTDWIFILDMTIELGAAKCLVILGISQEKFTRIIQQEVRSLQHEDVEVLSLEIMEKSPGTVISEKLKKLARLVGTPVQIISDWGSDIKKGIDLYRQENPGIITTYDITHKLANLLKKELLPDERFRDFLRQCSLTRQRVQQTTLYFLIPPRQRTKARYHNVDILIEWAGKVIKYAERQDFSLISTSYCLDDESLSLLSSNLSADILNMLKSLTPQIYENRHQFTQALLNYLGTELSQVQVEMICQCSDLGRRKFYAKFGWLFNYQPDIQIYTEIITQIHSVQKQIKNQGLHRKSSAQWLTNIAIHSLTSRGQKFSSQITEYLTFEAQQIPVDQIMLGTSDVIESIFGKYKLFTARRPVKDIGAMILLIPLFTLNLNTSLVKQAMESIRFIDVTAWTKSVFGSSMLSQRRNL
jgi:hypothetical protein